VCGDQNLPADWRFLNWPAAAHCPPWIVCPSRGLQRSPSCPQFFPCLIAARLDEQIAANISNLLQGSEILLMVRHGRIINLSVFLLISRTGALTTPGLMTDERGGVVLLSAAIFDDTLQ
jgi:hypothetical protein